MFFLREVGYHVTRARGKTVLSFLMAASLLCSLVGYLGSAYASRQTLQQLGEAVPVTLQVTNKNASHTTNLQIGEKQFQGLFDLGIREVHCTEVGWGVAPQETFDPDKGQLGTQMLGVSSGATLEQEGMYPTFLSGWEESCLEGQEALCLLEETWAEEHGLSQGGELTLSCYTLAYKPDGVFPQYVPVGEQVLEVAGTFQGSDPRGDIAVPVRWIWEAQRKAGAAPMCDSFQATVADPLSLNEFKGALLDLGLGEVNVTSPEKFYGNAVIFYDQQYIESAEQLLQNIATLETYLPAFALLVAVLLIVGTFYLVRSERRTMAIAVSLGRPRWKCGATYFVSSTLVSLLGGAAAALSMGAVTGLPWDQMARACGLFLGCVAVGVTVGIALVLRFSVLSMLSQKE